MKEGDWMKTYLKRLKNPATIIGLSGYVLTILSTLGFTIDNETVMTIIKSVCSICVLSPSTNTTFQHNYTPKSKHFHPSIMQHILLLIQHFQGP